MNSGNTVSKSIGFDGKVSLRGECRVPGDKSISHRAVMLASIAEGESVIKGFLDGADNQSTINAFESLGIGIQRDAPGSVTIEGKGLYGLREPRNIIDAGNSGTTARLISGILSAIPFFSVITGDASLRARPMARVIDPLRLMGANISGRGDGTLLPIAITGTTLTGIEYASPIASAQVKSALLFAGLYARGVTKVKEPYKSRDHTERMLKLFGAEVIVDGNSVSVKGGARLEGARIDVPGDISSAAFLMVAALITEGSEIMIKNVGVNPTRCGIIDILKSMGADIEILNRNDALEPTADILVKSSVLHGVTVSGAELLPAIDEFPAICVAAANAKGKTIISGAMELRVKESDRIQAMAVLLKALGSTVNERDDGIEIEGSPGGMGGGFVKSFSDHRVAMAAAIASLKCRNGVEIDDVSSVEVSFPGFFDLLDGLHA